jgi:integrase/recombinase XerD
VAFVLYSPSPLSELSRSLRVPELVANQGERATTRYLEFFAATIRNDGTRDAYARAAREFFEWCEAQGLSFEQVNPLVVATYVQLLTKAYCVPTVKLRLAAIRLLFDWLVTGHVLEINPAASVRGPKYVVKKGITPVLDAVEARALINSIDLSTIKGLRDRALIGVLVYSFARISAALGMNVEDYFSQGRQMWFRMYEKSSKVHDVPAHHTVILYLDEYLLAAGISKDGKFPIFRTVDARRLLTENRLLRSDALRMIKKQARKAGIETKVCCHSWRATGITNFISNGGTLENAARIAAHESTRTTRLYNRVSDAISLDEIERVRL